MTQAGYQIADIASIPSLAASDPGEAEWKPIRQHFNIRSFGTNAYVATSTGDAVVGEHNEIDESGTRHEELFFVAAGSARFTVAGEEFDAPAGTFVYIRDPAVMRAATAGAPGTTVLAVGGEPGAAFEISPWERKYVE